MVCVKESASALLCIIPPLSQPSLVPVIPDVMMMCPVLVSRFAMMAPEYVVVIAVGFFSVFRSFAGCVFFIPVVSYLVTGKAEARGLSSYTSGPKIEQQLMTPFMCLSTAKKEQKTLPLPLRAACGGKPCRHCQNSSGSLRDRKRDPVPQM